MTSSESINCPYCGESIPRKSAACPHCGSDEQTGWSDKTYLDGIDLGNDADYEELKEREFSGGTPRKLPVWQIVTALLLVVLFIAVVIQSLV
jgi:hypothetical protein